jgi:hypothetical protein
MMFIEQQQQKTIIVAIPSVATISNTNPSFKAWMGRFWQ